MKELWIINCLVQTMKSFYYLNTSKGILLEQEVISNKLLKKEYFSQYFVTSQQPDNLFTGFF